MSTGPQPDLSSPAAARAPARAARWAARTLLGAALAAMIGCALGAQPEGSPHVSASSPEEAGRYLILVGGCNDCHTPGWDRSSGRLPTSEWLTGNDIGYRGPWGTSYAANLRLSAQRLSEEAWVAMFRAGVGLPPMPWLNYTTMPERDLVAMYRFIRSLGEKGVPTPQPVPPGQEPRTPYILMVPQHPGGG
ncbi:cytochrome c precursor [Sorangium cellulosum]|uniref:Cytochrome c n=1 Tax=Sorangium cellulosum TaxID=56 RepID=A0A4P2PVY4_SORCE|nr:cytochrome C [Sorangium cellulosum]AUX20731.1 cytochrome c precursor [Sorangium cellulosum]